MWLETMPSLFPHHSLFTIIYSSFSPHLFLFTYLSRRRERKSLRVQMKLENIERVMRQGEYKKSLTLKKIETSDRYDAGNMGDRHITQTLGLHILIVASYSHRFLTLFSSSSRILLSVPQSD